MRYTLLGNSGLRVSEVRSALLGGGPLLIVAGRTGTRMG